MRARRFPAAAVWAAIAACTAAAPAARAQTTAIAAAPRHMLRIATVAPDGTAWARELKAFARDVEERTHGDLGIKWYFGGIAGDDLQSGERIRRGQLDAVASGGMLCERASPSLRAARLIGMYDDEDEMAHVLGRLRPTVEEEAKKNGYTNLLDAHLGPVVVYSRSPVANMTDLRAQRIWVWEGDEIERLTFREMGVPLVPLPLDGAGRAFSENRSDGFLSTPTATLAFQWSTQAKYVTPLKMTFLVGCIIVANRAFDRLPTEHQNLLRSAAAKLSLRLDDVLRRQDGALLGGLLGRTGVTAVPVSEGFRTDFKREARAATERLGERLVPAATLTKITQVLAEYRAARRPRGDAR